MGSLALMLLFFNRTLYTFCSKLEQFTALGLLQNWYGHTTVFFSISVEKVHLCNFFITRNMVVGSWRGI